MSLRAEAISFGYGREPRVLDNVSLDVRPGEIVALQGRSGRGKSTLGRLLAGYLSPQSGSVRVDGAMVSSRGFHPVQLIHQSAELAVNPRWSVERILCEAHAPDDVTCAAFGVAPEWRRRMPHELSAGQLQRISIVRTLSPQLRYLVADEITSMLDPISQAEIWRGLTWLAEGRRIGILAITHDASLAAAIAGRVISL
jgi:ABC-type dipeptide/oligopeptide/nickel transport system ATPase subunit